MAVALSRQRGAGSCEHDAALLRRYGHDVRAARRRRRTREQLASPLYLGRTAGTAPAPRWWTRRDSRTACARPPSRAGVRICEHSPVRDPAAAPPAGMSVRTAGGCIDARRVLLATGAYPPVLAQAAQIRRAGLRLRADERAAQRGPAAGNRMALRGRGVADMGEPVPLLPARAATGGSSGAATTPSIATAAMSARTATRTTPTFERLSQHFFTTFPQLEGLRFSHRWGGAIDTCSRFSLFVGTAHGGRVAYALGYTGPRRGREPLRRARSRSTCSTAAPPRRRAAADDPAQAAAVPARAAAQRGDPADAQPPRRGRPQRRQARALAAGAGPPSAWASTPERTGPGSASAPAWGAIQSRRARGTGHIREPPAGGARPRAGGRGRPEGAQEQTPSGSSPAPPSASPPRRPPTASPRRSASSIAARRGPDAPAGAAGLHPDVPLRLGDQGDEPRRPGLRHELHLGGARARVRGPAGSPGGWGTIAADFLAMASYAQVAGQYVFLLVGAEQHRHQPDERVGAARRDRVDRRAHLHLLPRDRSLGAPAAGARDPRGGAAAAALGRRAREGRERHGAARAPDAVVELVRPLAARLVQHVHGRDAADGLHLLGLGHDDVDQRGERGAEPDPGQRRRHLDLPAARAPTCWWSSRCRPFAGVGTQRHRARQHGTSGRRAVGARRRGVRRFRPRLGAEPPADPDGAQLGGRDDADDDPPERAHHALDGVPQGDPGRSSARRTRAT